MKKTIARSQKLTLMGEFWPYGLKKAGVSPGEYMRLLEDLGFTVHFFHEGNDPLTSDKVMDKYYYTDFYAEKR